MSPKRGVVLLINITFPGYNGPWFFFHQAGQASS